MSFVLISFVTQLLIATQLIAFNKVNNDEKNYVTDYIRILQKSIESLNEKQKNYFNNVDEVINSLKFNLKSFQNNFYKNNEKKQDIEKLLDLTKNIKNDFKQIKSYVYELNKHQVVKPDSYIQKKKLKNLFEKKPGEFALIKSNILDSVNNSKENNPPYEYKNPENDNFYSKNNIDNEKKEQLTFFFNANSKSNIYLQNLLDKKKLEKKKNFDISTIKGREKLKAYLKNAIESKSDGSFEIKNSISNNSCDLVLEKHDLKVEKNSLEKKPTNQIKLKYQDIVKFDSNNKKLKRIFVPGRGWVALKKLEEEEIEYGSASIIKSF